MIFNLGLIKARKLIFFQFDIKAISCDQKCFHCKKRVRDVYFSNNNKKTSHILQKAI